MAYKNESDVHHKKAYAVMERIWDGEWGTALLPEYIFAEVVTTLRARRGLEAAVAMGQALLRSREVEFVPCVTFFQDAFELFQSNPRGKLSFADAAIVAIARGRGTRHVATFDTDFRGIEGIEPIPS